MNEIIIALISSVTTLIVAILTKKAATKKTRSEILSIIENPDFEEITLKIKSKHKLKNKSLASSNPIQFHSVSYDIDFAENTDFKNFNQSDMDKLVSHVERSIYG